MICNRNFPASLRIGAFIMEKFRVGIIGATGMVGQRFVLLTANHPWFTPVVLAASAHSAGKTYAQAIEGKWHMAEPIPESVKSMIVMDAEADAEEIARQVDFVFCAVNMKKDEIKALEEKYAKLECPVVSNNSAHRHTPDVPMVVPEINADHIRIIDAQRKRLGTKRGFIAVKSNCSLQSYVPALHPLMKYGVEQALVCTYQAISGAGRTFETWPEMIDNVIPYIGGEEEKSEQEPMKLWGRVENGQPSAPRQFLHYFEEADRPQTKLDRMLEGGMAVSIGRLRPDTQYDYKFVCLSHNTLRGAAGGAVLLAELLCAEGYITRK